MNRKKILLILLALAILAAILLVFKFYYLDQRADKQWVESTTPGNGQVDVPSNTDILVKFNRNIDSTTLKPGYIKILDGKHGDRDLSKLFNYTYDRETRTPTIKFKNPESDFGSSNNITVIISGKIVDQNQNHMEADYTFGFTTWDK